MAFRRNFGETSPSPSQGDRLKLGGNSVETTIRRKAVDVVGADITYLPLFFRVFSWLKA